MVEHMERDWLALGLGAYGTIVATATAAYQFLRERPGAKVVVAPVSSVTDRTGDLIELWGVRVVNHRKRPITIRGVGLIRDRGIYAHGILLDLDGNRTREPFPFVLGDGEAVEIYISRNPTFREIRGAWARDALDRIYETRYPSRNPRSRWIAWRHRRATNRYIREREERITTLRAADWKAKVLTERDREQTGTYR